MNSPFITGDDVYLRPLDQNDLNENYVGWLNDSEVTRYLESGTFPYTKDELDEFYRRVSGTKDKVIMAVVERESDLHIGNVKLEPINWVHRSAEFGIMIGVKSMWGKGYGSETTSLTVEYAFTRLNLRKVSLVVVAKNIAALKTYQRLGFVTEGTKREDVFSDGKYEDVLWMGVLRDEFVAKRETRSWHQPLAA